MHSHSKSRNLHYGHECSYSTVEAEADHAESVTDLSSMAAFCLAAIQLHDRDGN